MKAAVIYARYSSDLQNDRSIEDQIITCRRLLIPGEVVTVTLSDRGISGAFMGNRPGVLTLLEMIESGKIMTVITEGLDRLSRSQEEIARIFALTDYHGVEIRTAFEGSINDLHVGMTGTMSALELKKIAERTRRGQLGAVLAGKMPGGLPYGYAVHPFNAHGEVEPGYRRIVPAEAEVVRAIYHGYLEGRNVTRIVRELNDRGIPSPRGALWGYGTVAGHLGRGNGILQNPIYCGRLIWNRHNFAKHPKTGRRTIRQNDPNQWIMCEAPELRIVDTGLWEAVQERRQTEHRSRPKPRRVSAKPGFDLYCGICAARLIAIDHRYLLCEGRKKTGLCEAARKIDIKRLYPRLFEEVVRYTEPDCWQGWERFVEENRRQAKSEIDGIEVALAAARKKARRYLKAIENGLGASKLVTEALLAAEQKIVTLERRRDEMLPAVKAILIDRCDLVGQVKAAGSDEARRQLVDDVVASVTVTVGEDKAIDIRDLRPRVT